MEFEQVVKEAKRKLEMLEGRTLRKCVVDIVEPEFNIIYLVFSNSIFAIHGANASEVIDIHQIDEIDSRLYKEGRAKEFSPFNIFLDRKICSARCMGEEWNGHGFELSFEGLLNKTMLIQSIYTGNQPLDLNDCIRLGIGNYYLSSDDLHE